MPIVAVNQGISGIRRVVRWAMVVKVDDRGAVVYSSRKECRTLCAGVSASIVDDPPFLYMVAAHLQVKSGLVKAGILMTWEIFVDALSLPAMSRA